MKTFHHFCEMRNGDFSRLTWGIEIEIAFNMSPELFRQRSRSIMQELYDHCQKNCRMRWNVGPDATCVPGMEVATVGPQDPGDLFVINNDLYWIREGVADLNPVSSTKCGTHVHIGGLTPEEKEMLKSAWAGGLQRYHKLVINRSRAADIPQNSYIGLISTIEDFKRGKNLVLADRGQTMEFRFFNTTLNGTVVRKWVEMCLHLCSQLANVKEALSGPRKLARLDALLGHAPSSLAPDRESFGTEPRRSLAF